MKLYHENEENSVKKMRKSIGKSKSMLAIKQMIRKVAKTDVPVLLPENQALARKLLLRLSGKAAEELINPVYRSTVRRFHLI